MSTLQNSIIKNYKTYFPNDTLKDISNKTNIQLTRVFRIFNGSEMKLCEYEKLEIVIDRKISANDFCSVARECFSSLSQGKLDQLYAEMKQFLKLSELCTPITLSEEFLPGRAL